jgi:hypothetical protein
MENAQASVKINIAFLSPIICSWNMACISWEDYIQRITDIGLFNSDVNLPEEGKISQVTVLNRSPAFQVIRKKTIIEPITIPMASDSAGRVYVLSQVDTGETFLGISNESLSSLQFTPGSTLKGTTPVRISGDLGETLQNILYYCNGITFIPGDTGCQCATITIQQPEAVIDSKTGETTFTTYTKDEVLRRTVRVNADLNCFWMLTEENDQGSWTIVPHTGNSFSSMPFYEDLPDYWFPVKMPGTSHDQNFPMRGNSISLSRDKDSNGRPSGNALSAITAAAFARLGKSTDEVQQKLAEAFKDITSIENNIDQTNGQPCVSDIFCTTAVNPNDPDSGPIVFDCCVYRFDTPMTVTFGPSQRDLAAFNEVFQWRYNVLATLAPDSASNVYKVVEPALCSLWQESAAATDICCEDINTYTSPSGDVIWKDDELWSKHSMFSKSGWTDPLGNLKTLVVVRPSYAQFLLNSPVMRDNLIVSGALFDAIQECWEALKEELPESEVPYDPNFADCNVYYEYSSTAYFCVVDMDDPTTFPNTDIPDHFIKQPAIKNALMNCASTSVSVCGGYSYPGGMYNDDFAGIVFAKNLATLDIQAKCNAPNGQTCQPTVASSELTDCCGEISIPAHGCVYDPIEGCVCGAGEPKYSYTPCTVTTVTPSDYCKLQIQQDSFYEPVKEFFQDSEECVGYTENTGGGYGATKRVPFLLGKWKKELQQALSSSKWYDGTITGNPNLEDDKISDLTGSGESNNRKPGGGGGGGGGGQSVPYGLSYKTVIKSGKRPVQDGTRITWEDEYDFRYTPCYQVEWVDAYRRQPIKLYNLRTFTGSISCDHYCAQGLSGIGYTPDTISILIRCTTSEGSVYYSNSMITLNGRRQRALTYIYGQTTAPVLTEALEPNWSGATGDPSKLTLPAQNNIPSLTFRTTATVIGSMTVTFPDGSTMPGECGVVYGAGSCGVPYQISGDYS